MNTFTKEQILESLRAAIQANGVPEGITLKDIQNELREAGKPHGETSTKQYAANLVKKHGWKRTVQSNRLYLVPPTGKPALRP